MVDVLNALSTTDHAVVPLVHVDIETGYLTADSVVPLNIPFYVDASIGELEVEVTHVEVITDVTVTLLDPAGGSRAVPCAEQSATEYAEIVCYVQVGDVQAGAWNLQALARPGDEVDLLYRVSGAAKASGSTFAAKLGSVIGETVAYPEPILIQAAVGKELPITGAVVTGLVEAPNSTISSVTLRDDGVAPDHLAADGIYSAVVKYGQDGDYTITVSFDNSAGTARFTDRGVGPHRDPILTPVGENFERFVQFQITVTGWEADDHDDMLERATVLQPDNNSVAGQIDYAGDVDTFVFTVPEGYNSTLIARISGLGLGIDPYVYTFDAERTFELESYLDFVPTSDDYLSVPLQVTGGQVIYVDVLHYNENAAAGLYEVSVGPELTREQASASDKNVQQPPSGKYTIHLPLISR